MEESSSLLTEYSSSSVPWGEGADSISTSHMLYVHAHTCLSVCVCVCVCECVWLTIVLCAWLLREVRGCGVGVATMWEAASWEEFINC